MCCVVDIEGLDSSLAALAQQETALRLRLGQALEVLGRGVVFDLGFSSLGAYAVERCECSVRWAEGARCLARRVEGLPGLRRAMAEGTVSWSMGELLARVASREDEARWLDLAACRTVRQVRPLVAEALAAARGAAARNAVGQAVRIEQRAGAEEAANANAAAGETEAKAKAKGAEAEAFAGADDGTFPDLQSDAGDEIRTLTCSVDHEDAWLFEATQYLLEHLGAHRAVEQVDALLAEAHGTLLGLLPAGVAEKAGVQESGSQEGALAQQHWVEQLRRWREQAEAACEVNLRGELLSARASVPPAERLLALGREASLGVGSLEHLSCTALDWQVRALAAALARHELELSRFALRFHRADGWRRLGYATEAQYARERLGLSVSSLRARRALALRLEKLPKVAAALGAARIGVEAAVQLVRIATPRTEVAWLERARRRTIKHLREEVAAALVAVRLAGEADCLPPKDTEMAAFQALEQAVVSGRFGEPRPASDDGGVAKASALGGGWAFLSEPASEARRAWCVMLGSLAAWLEGGLQTSADRPRGVGGHTCASAGRVALRLRMSRSAYAWWRELESLARRWLPAGMSWLRFLCLSVWHAWRHLLGTSVAYGHIYVRDRFRCMSPVCSRKDVTPHHLVFRSAGGSDEPRNIGSFCVWCHLRGVHGGRLRASGPASHIRWELGPVASPVLVVHGRERRAA